MADDKFGTVVFKDTTFGDLLEEIHESSKTNDRLILSMIEDLQGYIENLGDAIRMAPIIGEYVKMSITNNEHIIKMASIVQKALDRAKENSDDSGFSFFTQKDKEDLDAIMLEMKETKELPDSIVKPVIKAPKKPREKKKNATE